MYKNAIKMIWGVKNFLKKFLALFLALFGEKVAHLNSKHLRTLSSAILQPKKYFRIKMSKLKTKNAINFTNILVYIVKFHIFLSIK